jgi:hypothetical protein
MLIAAEQIRATVIGHAVAPKREGLVTDSKAATRPRRYHPGSNPASAKVGRMSDRVIAGLVAVVAGTAAGVLLGMLIEAERASEVGVIESSAPDCARGALGLGAGKEPEVGELVVPEQQVVVGDLQ